MAKKKKRTSKKPKTPSEKEVPKNSFWPLAGAILLIVLAAFILLGGFGVGGSLPVELFNIVYTIFGWAAYLTPLALAYFGILKFNSEDKQIPLDKLISTTSFIVLTAAAAQTVFVNTTTDEGGHGGYIGAAVGDATLLVLDKIPASILLIILAILAGLLSFNISPKVLIKPFSMLTRKSEKDTDLGDLKSKEDQFKLNEGVPTEHTPEEPKSGRLSSLKNTAQKLSAAQSHEALTTATDPDWKFPTIDLLNQKQDKADAGDIQANAQVIKETLKNFNIDVDMDGANIGPRVTQYTLKPPTGVKLTKITALENNLSLDLAAHSIRIEAPIPGKRLVGIEVPNIKPATVRIASVLDSQDWQNQKGPLSFVIGKDISGTPILGNLAKMPHLLVAGQTGSGKSVMLNTILTSMLYRNTPSDLKMILVDPKRVELTPYNDVPHLLSPVIHEPEKCISALKWAVAEMERRLNTMAEAGKRNIVEYNSLKKEEGMPYIVIVVDELADLMMMAARDVESLIVRIAQKARATGIHLILATQRPSVDVITGLIKANVPARVAFTTASQVDSRTIIDQMGAEKLLGQGDMLLLTANMPKPRRVQAAFISEGETAKVTKFIRDQRPPEYDDEIISQPVQLSGRGITMVDSGSGQNANDEMWRDAVRVVVEGRKASTSLLQRRLRVGYARAARLIETMEEQGIVGPADGARPREVLVSSVDDVFGRPGDSDGDVYDDMPDDEKA